MALSETVGPEKSLTLLTPTHPPQLSQFFGGDGKTTPHVRGCISAAMEDIVMRFVSSCRALTGLSTEYIRVDHPPPLHF